MKKIVLLVLAIILCTVPAFAASYSSNVWASWATATSTIQSFAFPYQSRHISITNGDATSYVCVSFTNSTNAIGNGNTLPATLNANCTPSDSARVMKIYPKQEISLQDIAINQINFKLVQGGAATASPISVIVTY